MAGFFYVEINWFEARSFMLLLVYGSDIHIFKKHGRKGLLSKTLAETTTGVVGIGNGGF